MGFDGEKWSETFAGSGWNDRNIWLDSGEWNHSCAVEIGHFEVLSSWVKEGEEGRTWTLILVCQQKERKRLEQKYMATNKQSDLLKSAFKCMSSHTHVKHTQMLTESSLEPDGVSSLIFLLDQSPLLLDQWIQLQARSCSHCHRRGLPATPPGPAGRALGG